MNRYSRILPMGACLLAGLMLLNTAGSTSAVAIIDYANRSVAVRADAVWPVDNPVTDSVQTSATGSFAETLIVRDEVDFSDPEAGMEWIIWVEPWAAQTSLIAPDRFDVAFTCGGTLNQPAFGEGESIFKVNFLLLEPHHYDLSVDLVFNPDSYHESGASEAIATLYYESAAGPVEPVFLFAADPYARYGGFYEDGDSGERSGILPAGHYQLSVVGNSHPAPDWHPCSGEFSMALQAVPDGGATLALLVLGLCGVLMVQGKTR